MKEVLDWWVVGWLFGKYGQRGPLPKTFESAREWLDGYKWGRAEIGRLATWREDLVRDCEEFLNFLDDPEAYRMPPLS